jgi:hypothetical protein
MISDGRDFFTGVFPSSSIEVYNDFVENNFNPFAIGFDNNKTSSYSQSIWNVNFNPLLNNVQQNEISNNRKLLTLIGGNYGFITGSIYTTESFQYQDFTDTYHRHSYPRYVGSQTTSTTYNTFSTKDSSYNLYGKNAAIDKNTTQFAFLSEVVTSNLDLLFANDRSNIYLKYLIDGNSNITELAKRNYERLNENEKFNLYQVQNIFKSSEVVNVSLFDYQNPSEQANLDGNKDIFAGGFRFYPTLWRTASINLVYNLDPTFFPNGASGGSPYNASDFQILSFFDNGGLFGARKVKYQIRKISGTVDLTTVITYRVRILISGLFNSYTERTYVGTMIAGSNITEFSPEYVGGKDAGPNYIVTVQPGGTQGQYKYTVVDTSPALRVHPTDKTLISGSAVMSQYYPGFYYVPTGSYSGSKIDYRFELNKGDLIRFMSGSVFIPQLEYEITDVLPPVSSSGQLVFRISSEVNNSATSSLNIIDRFIFARRIPDETNIVITHKKNDGATSAGIAKNSNLALEIDNKIGGIVSDLKTKLF